MKKANLALKSVALCLTLVIALACLPMVLSASPAVFYEKADPVPINPNANQTCKNFYQYLWNIGKTDKVISGAQSYLFAGTNGFNRVDPEGDNHKWLSEQYGYNTVIFGDMTEVQGRLGEGYIDEIAKRYKKGAVPMFGFEAASFRKVQDDYSLDIKDWVANYDSTNPDRDMDMYNSYREELKIEADGFEAMEKAGVEVYMYRFFAEINNTRRRGFYGATEKGYAALRRVWQQAVEYFTVERGLTGILFVFCQCGYADSSDFWPGDNYVDIIGPTGYARAGNGEIFAFENLVDYEWIKTKDKPFGYTELAPRSFDSHERLCPIGDYKKLLESVIYTYPECAFINTWYTDAHALAQPGRLDNYGNYNSIYYMNSPNVLKLEDVPNFSTGIIDSIGIAQFYKGNKYLGNLDIGKYSADNLKKKGIDIAGVDRLDTMHGTAILAYASKDCSGKPAVVYGNGQKLTSSFKSAKSLAVVKLENLAFEKNVWIEGNEAYNAVKLNDGLNESWEYTPINNDKTSIIIDLGKVYNIGQISINHAGFYEDFRYNLRDFEIYVSENGVDYKPVYQNFGNVYPASDFRINPVNARFVKLKVLTANSSISEIEKNRVSIAEIEVYGMETDKVNMLGSGGGIIVDNNTSNSTSGSITDLNNNIGLNADNIGGNNSNIQKSETKKSENVADPKPDIPAIVIPEFYNYVWIIIVGGVLLLAGGVSLSVYFINKNRNKAE